MYYPKSQIKPNQYSNGTLIFKLTKEPYYGYYHAVSNGKFFVGRNATGRQTKELILPFPDSEKKESSPGDGAETMVIDYRFGTNNNYNYSTLLEIDPESPVQNIPPPYYSQPTEEDREIGEYQRYFSKKTNELIYTEISKDTYTKFQSNDPKVSFNLYEVISLPWSLESLENRILNLFETNKNIVAIIEKDNNWYGFSQYMGFSGRGYTNGGELKLPNGKIYIGSYHTMPNGTFMTGASHGEGNGIILTPISPTFTPGGTGIVGGGGGY